MSHLVPKSQKSPNQVVVICQCQSTYISFKSVILEIDFCTF
jgi:hypothetical protein